MIRVVTVTFTVDDGVDHEELSGGKTQGEWRTMEQERAVFTGFESNLIHASTHLFRIYQARSFRCEYTVRDGNGVMVTAGVVIKREDNPLLQLQYGQEYDGEHDGTGPDVNLSTGDEADTYNANEMPGE